MDKNYYVFQNGSLKRKDDTIYVITEDDKHPLPVKKVGSLHLFGELEFNTRFFSFLNKEETPAHYYNWFDRYAGSYYPQEFLNSGRTLVNQVLRYDDQEERMTIAGEVVKAATENMVENLHYYERKGKNVESAINEMRSLQDGISDSTTPDELRGIEGNIRKVYYSTFQIFSVVISYLTNGRSSRQGMR